MKLKAILKFVVCAIGADCNDWMKIFSTKAEAKEYAKANHGVVYAYAGCSIDGEADGMIEGYGATHRVATEELRRSLENLYGGKYRV